MSPHKNILYCFILISLFSNTQAQEWKNIRQFRKRTGKLELDSSAWLKQDRKQNSKTWQLANLYNLKQKSGYTHYKSIRQVRDFYKWFDAERKKIGHETTLAGVAAIVANQLSYFENWFIRKLIVRDKHIINFGEQGSRDVLRFFFPYFQELIIAKKPIRGETAKQWDFEKAKEEQCNIVEKIYLQTPQKSVRKLQRMAKGKGIFRFGVPSCLKYEGEILDCKARYEHAFFKLRTYYKQGERCTKKR